MNACEYVRASASSYGFVCMCVLCACMCMHVHACMYQSVKSAAVRL